MSYVEFKFFKAFLGPKNVVTPCHVTPTFFYPFLKDQLACEVLKLFSVSLKNSAGLDLLTKIKLIYLIVKKSWSAHMEKMYSGKN